MTNPVTLNFKYNFKTYQPNCITCFRIKEINIDSTLVH